MDALEDDYDTKDEDPYVATMGVIEELGLANDVTIRDIDRCHRTGPKTETDQRRKMLIKFPSYQVRRKGLAGKGRLKDSDSPCTLLE